MTSFLQEFVSQKSFRQKSIYSLNHYRNIVTQHNDYTRLLFAHKTIKITDKILNFAFKKLNSFY